MRGAGEGTFYRDERGRYCWKLRVGSSTYVRKAATRKDLNTKVAAARALLLAGRMPVRIDAQATCETYLRAWLGDYVPTRALKTQRNYRQVIENYAVPVIGQITLANLKARACQQMLTDMAARGLSPSTVNNARTVLKKAFDGATVGSPPLIVSNPWNATERMRPSERDVRFIPPASEKRLRTVLVEPGDDGLPRLQYAPLLALILDTGLRISEANALRPEDVEGDMLSVRWKLTWLEEGDYKLEPTKSRSGRRMIPLTPNAVAMWRAMLAIQKRDRLRAGEAWAGERFAMLTETGRPFTPSNVSRALRECLKHAGIKEPYGLHDLRRTFASRLARSGTPPHVLQRLLGHSSITTTMSYYVGHDLADLRRGVGIVEGDHAESADASR